MEQEAMIAVSTLAFPRRTPHFERVLSQYLAGTLHEEVLEKAARNLRLENWRIAAAYHVTQIPSNDFLWMSRSQETIAMLNAWPRELDLGSRTLSIRAQIELAGRAQQPELPPNGSFSFGSKKVLADFLEAKDHGILTRPVIMGPVSFLLEAGGSQALSHLGSLVVVYRDILVTLAHHGCQWVQMEEPCLGVAADATVVQAAFYAYCQLAEAERLPKIMLVPKPGTLGSNLLALIELPLAGFHLDLGFGLDELPRILEFLPSTKALSLGVLGMGGPIPLRLLRAAWAQVGDRLELAPSTKAGGAVDESLLKALDGLREDVLQRWSVPGSGLAAEPLQLDSNQVLLS